MDYLVQISEGLYIDVSDIDFMTDKYVVLMDKTVVYLDLSN